jgi:hypothetical protein
MIGQIRNDNAVSIKYVQAVSTLYDGTGAAIGCSSGYANNTDLGAGQTTAFKIIHSGRDYHDVSTYRIQTDGIK